jgi:hypothetical protein
MVIAIPMIVGGMRKIEQKNPISVQPRKVDPIPRSTLLCNGVRRWKGSKRGLRKKDAKRKKRCQSNSDSNLE